MNKYFWLLFNLLVITVAGYVVVQYFILDGTQAGLVQMKLIFLSKLSHFWYVMLFLHAATSVVALVIGPFTLSSRFREKNISRHRVLGRLYMLCILFGGITGLYLSFYATGGFVGKIGFGLLAVFWLISAFQAFTNAKNHRVPQHRNWMIRNYSLTFAAVTLRLWLPLFALLFGLENFERSYAVISWLAWVPNLLVAEMIIQQKRTNEHFKTNGAGKISA
ncbi:putative membrane protein [Sporosarcina luteola]|nr:putative membrane protein [Sporosarcina luteola]